MQTLARISSAVLKACCMLSLAAFGCAFGQPGNPFPEAFPDFSYLNAPTWLLPDGKKLWVGSFGRNGPPHAVAVVRTLPDGSPDPEFGTAGLAKLTVWGAAEYGSVVVAQPDGKILMAGGALDPANAPACDYWAFCSNHIALFRIDQNGSPDLTFNRTGRLVFHIGPVLPGLEDPPDRLVAGISLQPDGTILIATGGVPVAARVLSDGTLDRAFVANGFHAIEASNPVAVAYYHRLLDQYFVTADTAEIARLDRSTPNRWRWAGEGFHVFPAGSNLESTVPVCRFYGKPESGLDSHVLSANADECAALETAASSPWILESREVFRVVLPDADSGTCPKDHPPVYRLWNGRPDGGHHLTIDRTTRQWLVDIGYIPEGWGPDGVAMCAAP